MCRALGFGRNGGDGARGRVLKWGPSLFCGFPLPIKNNLPGKGTLGVGAVKRVGSLLKPSHLPCGLGSLISQRAPHYQRAAWEEAYAVGRYLRVLMWRFALLPPRFCIPISVLWLHIFIFDFLSA